MNGPLMEEYSSTMQSKERFPWRCLIVPAVISAVLFLLTALHGPEAFRRAISSPDTWGYTSIAWSLLKEGQLPPESTRTLGYPLYLTGCFWAGGETYGYHLAIAVQLLLNLLLLPLTWSFLQSLSSQLSPKIRLIAAFCVWFGGLGLAWQLLTDFLAGFCFDVFLWGFCFRRTRACVALGGASLFYATLTRPTFNFLFIILPFLPLLVRRFAFPLTWKQLVFYLFCSLCALGVNIVEERHSCEVKNKLFSVKEYAVILWYTECTRGGSVDENLKSAMNEFHQILEKQTGKPFESLTRRERDEASRKVMQNLIISRPQVVAGRLVKRALKILFAPLDGPARWVNRILGSENTLPIMVRGPIILR